MVNLLVQLPIVVVRFTTFDEVTSVTVHLFNALTSSDQLTVVRILFTCTDMHVIAEA